ncbi:VgrG-related protein [Agromyces bauzanensis]|uniref:Type IV secretion protein Rhs n=1 Tax=Agromyces bauzanensis TaxID=1308924 RepID=A0A917PU13_9MICO|nr:VgrG-related protein [Agromyces bauzanensis]GGJ91581.1 type IV secretion protein Rhs [Agromyces bauzanensis]
MPSSVDTYTSLLLVSVGGTALPPDAAGLLERSRVTDAANLPDSFELEFVDSAGAVLEKGGFTIGASVTLAVSQNGADGPQKLLDAEVTALDREDVGGELRTRVRGLDTSHRLFRGRRVAAYVDMSTADIVQKVAQRAGVKVGSVSGPATVMPHTTQDNVSDWVFLKRLADDAGCVFSVVDGKLEFGPPTAASTAISGSSSAVDDPIVIEHGRNTVYLHATITSAEQVSEVEVRGWDVAAKQKVVSTAPAKTQAAELPTLDPAKVAEVFSSPRYVSGAGTGAQQPQDKLAEAIASRIAGGFAEIEAQILGNPRIHSGTAVRLSGFGAPFDGRYTVTESKHEFSSEQGYTTTLVVSDASDRSLLGVGSRPGPVVAGAGAGGAGTGMPGVVSALVSDVSGGGHDDGRVRLTFPFLSDDYVSGWARVVQPGAGAERGAVVLPEVGDEVLVAFEAGRFDRPVVLGGLYNGKDLPQGGWGSFVESGSVVRRSFTSRTGMIVEFLERPGEESLRISTNEGAQHVTLTQTADRGIQIVSEGPVSVTAERDATITTEGNASVTASHGDIALSAMKIALEASAELAISAPNVKVDGSASLDLSGAKVAVKGSGTAEFSSSGVTVVKGSLVQIN